MAIQVIKGTGHSLQQTDTLATVTVDPITRAVTPSITEGQLVYVDTSGAAQLVPCMNNATRADATNRLRHDGAAQLIGFAVNNTDEGDVIESGKMGIYLLDGDTIIGTDQVTNTLTVGDLTLNGLPVIQAAYVDDTSNDGMVTVGTAGQTNDYVIGWVAGAPRNIFVGFTPVTVLPIKLNA